MGLLNACERMPFNRSAGAVLALALAVVHPFGLAQPASEPEIIAQIDRADRHHQQDLAGYTVEEHYTIINSHFQTPAKALVKVTYSRDTGKSYEVLSRSGPSLLANRVLNSMLAEEQKLSRSSSRSLSEITPAT
jgi:hypothetical protein